MLGDRLAHRLPRLRVLERIIGRSLRQTQPLRRNARPRAVEDAHRDLEPLSLVAEQVRRRNTHVLEHELPGRRPLDPHLRLDARHLESRRVSLDDERRDPRMSQLGVRLREHGVEVRHTRVGDEPLGSVQDVLAIFKPRRRAHSRRVRSGARLGERVGTEPLAGRQTWQVPLLLLLIAGELEAERPELLHGEDQSARGADLRDLLDRDERQKRPGPEASVLFLVEEPEEVVLPEELDDVPGKLVALVDLRRPRRNPFTRELTNEVADLALLLRKWLVHHDGESSF